MADILHPDPDDSDPESPATSPTERRPEGPLDREDFAKAATADDRFQAELLLQACEELGIPALLWDPRGGMVGPLSSPVDAFVVAVPAREVERARALLAQRRGALEAAVEEGARAAEEEEAQGERGAAPPDPAGVGG